MSHRDLHSEHIPLSAAGTLHNQQAHILIADRITLSHVLFGPTHSNNALESIVVAATEVLIALGTETVITLTSSKDTIVINDIKIIIIRTNVVFSLLFGIDQLRRPAPCAEEEEQDQCKLYLVPLCGDCRSVAGPVVVEQKQEVVHAQDGLRLDCVIQAECVNKLRALAPWIQRVAMSEEQHTFRARASFPSLVSNFEVCKVLLHRTPFVHPVLVVDVLEEGQRGSPGAVPDHRAPILPELITEARQESE